MTKTACMTVYDAGWKKRKGRRRKEARCVWRSDILLDDGGHDVVELEEGLDVDWQAGAPVAGLWVEAEPGQGVVTLQHVPTHDSRQL